MRPDSAAQLAELVDSSSEPGQFEVSFPEGVDRVAVWKVLQPHVEGLEVGTGFARRSLGEMLPVPDLCAALEQGRALDELRRDRPLSFALRALALELTALFGLLLLPFLRGCPRAVRLASLFIFLAGPALGALPWLLSGSPWWMPLPQLVFWVVCTWNLFFPSEGSGPEPVCVPRAQAPRFFAWLDALSEEVGKPRVSAVQLGPSWEAGLQQRGRRAVLELGVERLEQSSEEELAVVVCHELGHIGQSYWAMSWATWIAGAWWGVLEHTHHFHRGSLVHGWARRYLLAHTSWFAAARRHQEREADGHVPDRLAHPVRCAVLARDLRGRMGGTAAPAGQYLWHELMTTPPTFCDTHPTYAERLLQTGPLPRHPPPLAPVQPVVRWIEDWAALRAAVAEPAQELPPVQLDEPETAADWFVHARGLYLLGRVPEAEHALEQVLVREPTHADALHQWLEMLVLADRFEEAAQIAAGHREAWATGTALLMGQVYEVLDRPTEALAAVRLGQTLASPVFETWERGELSVTEAQYACLNQESRLDPTSRAAAPSGQAPAPGSSAAARLCSGSAGYRG